MIQIRHFHTRLMFYFLALLLPILLGTYFFVYNNNRYYTTQTINSYLESGAGVFDFTLQEQSTALLSILSSLTWDFGFRSAYASGDPGTLYDASVNVLNRSMGSVHTLMVVDMEGSVLIDTALQGYEKVSGDWEELLRSAEQDPRTMAGRIIEIDNTPHQVIPVPLFLPRQVAWIIGGFPLDSQVLESVKQNTLSDVSLINVVGDQVQVLNSTLPADYWAYLAKNVNLVSYAEDIPQLITLDGLELGTLIRELSNNPSENRRTYGLIHRSYDENLANEEKFNNVLLQFYFLALFFSIIAIYFLSRTVTNPIASLVSVVKKIEQGEFSQRASIASTDELGQLASSVNSMAQGLEGKEKVRDLLGKVVSRQVADELMRSPVELGGEEREVTVLYADIKGFTSYCEKKNPKDVLNVLNQYLGQLTRIIESHYGIVDKFTGDGVMAIFGAPISRDADIDNALQAALQIKKAFSVRTGGLEIAIGVHTGLAVAGNLGSQSRLNYSVIGDSVNLASRLEGLTRVYNVPCVVSEDTVKRTEDFLFRELDWVKVRGRQEPVRIYELVGDVGRVTKSEFEEVRLFEAFMHCYRRRNWAAAIVILSKLSARSSYQGLYNLYRQRIEDFQLDPPGPEWQGIFSFERK